MAVHTVYLSACSLPVSGNDSRHFFKQCWEDQACQKLFPVRSLTISFLALISFFFPSFWEWKGKLQVAMWIPTGGHLASGPQLFFGMFYLVVQMPPQRLYLSLWFTDTLKREKGTTKLQAKLWRNKGQTLPAKNCHKWIFLARVYMGKASNWEYHWKS